jgi:crotonobetainyl-CoA hydratase
MDLLMTGRRMGVDEAKKYGLVNRTCSVKNLKKQAIEWAHQIAQSAPLALSAIKSVIQQTEGMDLESAYAYMRSGKIDEYNRMLESEDANEGPLAFSENRAPKWKGK